MVSSFISNILLNINASFSSCSRFKKKNDANFLLGKKKICIIFFLNTGSAAQTFGVNEHLSVVRLFLQMNQLEESPGQLVLSTIMPKKPFEEEAYDRSLKDFGISFYVMLKAEIVDFKVEVIRVEPKRVLDEGLRDSCSSVSPRVSLSGWRRTQGSRGRRSSLLTW